jgi:glycosyltransferase involved in cell wall biosynthesis
METFYTNLLPLREKLLFRGIKLASFSLLKGPYKKLLGNKHIIIANSRITATLLHILYGIEPDEIVYPPLDTDIFKPRNMIKKNQVLLYLGSHAGDTDQNFVIEICKVLRAKDFKILVIGNAILRERLRNKFEIYSVSGISDEELSNIYSESKLTICPQKWETFGYIPVESVACGTPVLTFNCMGLGETIINGKMGLLAKNKQEFLEILGSTLENKEIQIDRNFTREYIEENFSINASTERLEVIFRRMR